MVIEMVPHIQLQYIHFTSTCKNYIVKGIINMTDMKTNTPLEPER